MMESTFRLAALSIAIGLVIISCTYAMRTSLDLGGVCLLPPSYISNDELIRIAAESINNDPLIQVRTTARHTPLMKQIPYPNVDAMLQANPDCCRVEWGADVTGGQYSLLSKLTGIGTAGVFIDFTATFIDSNSRPRRQKLFMMNLWTSCGTNWSNQPWNWRLEPIDVM